MQRSSAEHHDSRLFAVPAGAPSWITSELIEKTISVWQRFYRHRLTAAEAVEMLISVGNLFGVLRDAAQPKGA
jgi:hypothetical protein